MKIEPAHPVVTTAMVLAGGRVGELSVLTMQRPRAALCFAGYFRVIDFALSNLMHAGITRVGILSQYRPASLIEHVGTGESWDFMGLDRGAKILPPFWGGEAGDWYHGNADAVEQNWNFVEDVDSDLVLVLSGDHIYRMDYRDLIQSHLESGADMTIGFKRMPFDPHYGYGTLDESGRVVEYVEKPAEPRGDLASLTVYVVNRHALKKVFASGEARNGKLLEFGKDVIPYMLANGFDIFGYEYDGYWAYTRTVPGYYRAHLDLLSGQIDMDSWGVRTNLQDTLVASQPPARFGIDAEVHDSFISTGCQIEGEVIHSVLSPGVQVARGARVVDSILSHNTIVEEGCQVVRTISDKHVRIGAGTLCGAIGEEGAGSTNGNADDETPRITLLGKRSRVEAGSILKSGATILPEGSVGPSAGLNPSVTPGTGKDSSA